jgi:RNA polymerase sigma-70 factor (ECF subfamily)
LDINEIIKRCIQDDRIAQQTLYDSYAPLMLGVCRRYIEQTEDAEDVMIEGFFKILLICINLIRGKLRRMDEKNHD